MIIDNKLQLKNYLSDNKLNNGGKKTTIDQSAVASGGEANVELDLNSESDEDKTGNPKSKKKKKNNLTFLENKTNKKTEIAKSDTEIKSLNMRLLNLV